jgi:hypothetical protein
MFALLAILSLMVAPSFGARRRCDNKEYIRYLTEDEIKENYGDIDLSTALLDAYVYAYAYGFDTVTDDYVEVVQLDGVFNFFAATVIGATADSDGFVTVFNTATGEVLDCDLMIKKRWVGIPVKGRGCVYNVDKEIFKICKQARGEFEVDVFATGAGGVVTDQATLQLPDFSATEVSVGAFSDESLSTSVSTRDAVLDGRTGNVNIANANLLATQIGDDNQQSAEVKTSAGPNSTSSSVSITASSSAGGK